MLRLYDARSRLSLLKSKGAIEELSLSGDALMSHLSGDPILMTLADTLDVQSAYQQIVEKAAHAFLVTRDTLWLGIARKESLEIIHKSNRFEAMQLPLTSIMLRSFILIPDSCTVLEAVDEFINKRALGAVLVSDDGAPVNAITVDWLEKRLRVENLEDQGARRPVPGARQAQRA